MDLAGARGELSHDAVMFEVSKLGHAGRIVGLNSELQEHLAASVDGTPHFGAKAVGREFRNLDPIEPNRPPVSDLILKSPRFLVKEQPMSRWQPCGTSLELLGQVGRDSPAVRAVDRSEPQSLQFAQTSRARIARYIRRGIEHIYAARRSCFLGNDLIDGAHWAL
jgi:hypothetical protein